MLLVKKLWMRHSLRITIPIQLLFYVFYARKRLESQLVTPFRMWFLGVTTYV